MRKKKFQFRVETAQLEQKSVTWYLALRILPSKKENEQNILFILLDKLTGELIKTEFLQQTISPRKVLQTLETVMLSAPSDQIHVPFRPVLIELEQEDFVADLAASTSQIGIAVNYQPQPQLVDEFIPQIFQELSYRNGELNFLNIPGMNVELAREFYKSAAECFHQSPWELFDDTQPLEISFQPEGESLYIFILGQAEAQFGFMFFSNWEDMLAVMAGDEGAFDAKSEHQVLALNYEKWRNIPEADLKAIQAYGWEIASDNAYPNTLLYTREDFKRPDAKQISRQTIALKAITRFIQENLHLGEDGDYLPARDTYEIHVNQTPITVEISYPVKQIHELKTSHHFGLIEADQPHVQASLKLADQAWHADDPQERIELAEKALSLWPDCIEAFIILGEEADEIEEALQYFQEGVKASERALDMKVFEQFPGNLWDIYMVKRYLISIQGMVECLVEMEEYENALTHARKILQTNPADHQGMRYTVLFILTQLKRDDLLLELLDQYSEEMAASWPYSRALLEFRQRGENRKARLYLNEAIDRNPYIPDYLLGKKSIPEELPEYDSFGDESEAIHYARDYFTAWWQTKGAIHWLKENLKS